MFAFFHKYQKGIFIVTTGLVVLSFFFFGTAGVVTEEKPKEEFLLKSLDGSKLSLQKVDRMVQFISSSQMDLKDDGARFVNLLNDGVLEKQFLQTSLGKLLAEKIADSMDKDLQGAVEKVVSFDAYRHPKAPFLSAYSMWSQFAPESVSWLEELKSRGFSLSSLKKFDLLSKAYLAQKQVPFHFLRQILSYQEQQSVQASDKDTSLSHTDLSLFGLHAAKDWFGKTYLQAAAQVIIQGSAYAKKQGYKVSTQEARDFMVALVKDAARLLYKDLPADANFYQMFLGHTRQLGMTEAECIDLCKDVMLFRKAFDHASEDFKKPSMDHLAKEQALAACFSLPTHLELRDFSSWMKLQVYIDAVSLHKRTSNNLLSLPKEFLSLTEIEKKAPALVQRDYTLEYAELDVKKAAAAISLKEMWQWQTGPQGWELLKKEYASYLKKEAVTKEERFALLEALSIEERKEVDKFSREKILMQDPTRIRKELASKKKESHSYSISLEGSELPFKGVNGKELVSLLEKAPLKSDSPSPVTDKLSFYTGDQIHYYSISVSHRADEKKLQTFAAASKSGTLHQMLDKKLENAYGEVRKKNSLPYMKKDGSWKSFTEVKDLVGEAVFAPAMQAIVKEYEATYGKKVSEEELQNRNFYAENALLAYVKKMLAEAQKGSVKQETGPIVSQWNLVETKETVVKKENDFLSSLSFVPGTWSSILSKAPGKLAFYKILETLEPASASSEEVEKLVGPLRKEKQQEFFLLLFDEMQAKKAFALPLTNS